MKIEYDTIVVNLYGGPSSGKSTTAAQFFAWLKLNGFESELATEYAKDKVWQGNLATFQDQFYVSAHQHNRVFSLCGQVAYVVTDSPVLMSATYANPDDKALKDLIVDRHSQYNNINIWVDRDVETYSENGRLQTLEEAQEIDGKIKEWVESVDKFHFNINKYVDMEEVFKNIRWAVNKFNIGGKKPRKNFNPC